MLKWARNSSGQISRAVRNMTIHNYSVVAHTAPAITIYVDPVLGQCWPCLEDAVPTLTQHRANVSRHGTRGGRTCAWYSTHLCRIVFSFSSACSSRAIPCITLPRLCLSVTTRTFCNKQECVPWSSGAVVVNIIIDLKRQNQAKIIKKTLFLFWFLNMAITCEHVHRLELRKFKIVKIVRNLISDMHVQYKKYGNNW